MSNEKNVDEIYKDGKKVNIRNPNDANDLGIGMVHQHFKLVEVFSVLDNIILGAEDTKMGVLKKKEARKKVLSLSEKYGLRVDPDALIEDIFQELDLGLTEEAIHYAYLLSVAQRVLLGEQTARSAFRLLCQAYVDNGFRRGPFDNFYLWDDIADDLERSSGDWESEGMRKDNLEEWMHQYFEKLVRANRSYCLFRTENASVF